MLHSFFNDDRTQHDIAIDIEHFSELLAEYAGSYKKSRMIARMKEIYRNQSLLIDFIIRLRVDLRYLIELTYHYDHSIVTPQLAKELKTRVDKYPNYPHYGE